MTKRISLANGQSTVKLTCIKCNETTPVTTNYPEKYTEEILKNYTCSHCKSGRLEKKSTIAPAPKKESVIAPKTVVKENMPVLKKTEITPTTKPTTLSEADQTIVNDIVAEITPTTKPTTLSEADQTIVSDIVAEITDDLEKLGDYDDLEKAIIAEINTELTKKLPKDKLKEAMKFSKTLYMVS